MPTNSSQVSSKSLVFDSIGDNSCQLATLTCKELEQMGAVGIVNYVNLNKTKYAANGESELDIVYENWTRHCIRKLNNKEKPPTYNDIIITVVSKRDGDNQVSMHLK